MTDDCFHGRLLATSFKQCTSIIFITGTAAFDFAVFLAGTMLKMVTGIRSAANQLFLQVATSHPQLFATSLLKFHVALQNNYIYPRQDLIIDAVFGSTLLFVTNFVSLSFFVVAVNYGRTVSSDHSTNSAAPSATSPAFASRNSTTRYRNPVINLPF